MMCEEGDRPLPSPSLSGRRRAQSAAVLAVSVFPTAVDFSHYLAVHLPPLLLLVVNASCAGLRSRKVKLQIELVHLLVLSPLRATSPEYRRPCRQVPAMAAQAPDLPCLDR
ncbi:hypothetical protein EJB05_06542, partial [Eragrostis curvula]